MQHRTAQHLMQLAVNRRSIPQFKGYAFAQLDKIMEKYASQNDAFAREMVREITAFKKDPSKLKVVPTPKIPDGSPIGTQPCSLGHLHNDMHGLD